MFLNFSTTAGVLAFFLFLDPFGLPPRFTAELTSTVAGALEDGLSGTGVLSARSYREGMHSACL